MGLSVLRSLQESLGALEGSHVAMHAAEAGDLLADRFGVRGSLTRLATEKDDTFKVELPSGSRCILKVAHPAESPAGIDMQTALLRHIATTAPSLPVPRVIPDREAADHTRIVDRAGQARYVHLLTYCDGTPLDATQASATQRRRIGRVLGQLRRATAEFRHPADSRTLAWDVTHLKTLSPLLDDIDDPARRAPLAEALARFDAVVEPALHQLRRQVLHNDFSRSNIVVDHAAEGFVTGIIDFGDAVRTAIAIDVSTALVNQLPRDLAERPRDDIFAEGRDVLSGYLEVADLTETEISLIPHLVMARLVARALLSLWRARRFPDNAPYLLRNTAPGWAQLDWFLARSPATVAATLHGALA